MCAAPDRHCVAGGDVGQAAKDTGKKIEHGAHDTGKKIEHGAHDAASSAQDAGNRAQDKASSGVNKAEKKADRFGPGFEGTPPQPRPCAQVQALAPSSHQKRGIQVPRLGPVHHLGNAEY